MTRLTAAKAVAELDAIDGPADPERAHDQADEVLLRVVPPEVAEAYRRLVDRSPWWAGA